MAEKIGRTAARRSVKKPRPYSGILAKPFILDARHPAGRPGAGLDTLGPKLSALFDHFGVDHWDFTKLCLELAGRHVPGFTFVASAGAPKRWMPIKQALLIRAVARYQAGKSGHSGSVSSACQHIANSGAFEKHKAANLERRYYEAIEDEEINTVVRFIAEFESADSSGERTQFFNLSPEHVQKFLDIAVFNMNRKTPRKS